MVELEGCLAMVGELEGCSALWGSLTSRALGGSLAPAGVQPLTPREPSCLLVEGPDVCLSFLLVEPPQHQVVHVARIWPSP